MEPFPDEILKGGFAGLAALEAKKVQEVRLDVFDRLESGDILFIDTSHVVKTAGDVNYLFLEVVPRLNPGVIIHVHDIFFPKEYPKEWVLDQQRFWTEQYLLQAFLAFNSEFEVLFGNSYIATRYPDAFRSTFPKSPWWGG